MSKGFLEFAAGSLDLSPFVFASADKTNMGACS